MPANAIPSVEIRSTKTIPHRAPRSPILHTSGKVPKNELLRLLKRAFRGKQKGSIPSPLRTALISVRTSTLKAAADKNASRTDWANLLDQVAADVFAAPRVQGSSDQNSHDAPSFEEDEYSGPTGTFVLHGTADAGSALQTILGKALDQDITEAEIARGKSQPVGPVSLKGPLGEAFAGIAYDASLTVFGKDIVRDAAGQVLRRKSHIRNLPVQSQAHSKTGDQAPVTRVDKTSRADAVSEAPPPSYDEAMSIPSAPRHYPMEEILALENSQAPAPDEDEHPDLQRLDSGNRVALLELARNLVPRFEGDTKDTLYKIARELDKPKPELSRYAFDWMMDRAKQLANNEVLVRKLRGAIQEAKSASGANGVAAPAQAIEKKPKAPSTHESSEGLDSTQEVDLAQQLAHAKGRLRKASATPAEMASRASKEEQNPLADALLKRVDQQEHRIDNSHHDQQRNDDEWAV